MSDVQTIWKLSLALGCSVGAYWLGKWSCGVGHDDEADFIRDGMGERVDRGSSDFRRREADAMKEQDEPRGQIIDFDAARARMDSARRARARRRAHASDVRQ